MIRNILFSIFFFSGIILISIFFIPSLFLPQKIALLGGKIMGLGIKMPNLGKLMKDNDLKFKYIFNSVHTYYTCDPGVTISDDKWHMITLTKRKQDSLKRAKENEQQSIVS